MNARSETVLLTLVHKVRWLTIAQVGRLLGISSPAIVRRLLGTLEGAGLIRRLWVQLPPGEAVREPLVTWTPGAPAPTLGPLAYRMGARWSGPTTPTMIVLATIRAARLLGGHQGRLQQTARAHDGHVANVYLQFRRIRPLAAMDWVSEAALKPDRYGQVLPDAAIVNENGQPRLIIEIVGHYPVERLQRFHADCVARGLPYELW